MQCLSVTGQVSIVMIEADTKHAQAFQSEKLEGCNLWKALLEAPEGWLFASASETSTC